MVKRGRRSLDGRESSPCPNEIGEIKEMQRGAGAAERRATLFRIASLIAPIVRKHGWFVQSFGEFMPRFVGLLGMNVNKGQKILIRLRAAHDGVVMPLEHLVDVTLHELAHIDISCHSAEFYKLLDQLRGEFEAGAGKIGTVMGNSFEGVGYKLGGAHRKVENPMTSKERRSAALVAAERRRGGNVGGNLLGGFSYDAKLTPRERAFQAAERRRRDASSCISVLAGNDQDEDLEEQLGLKGNHQKNSSSSLSSSNWSCLQCTLTNHAEKKNCSACGLERPPEMEICNKCGTLIPLSFSSCVCGTMRKATNENKEACKKSKKEKEIVDLT